MALNSTKFHVSRALHQVWVVTAPPVISDWRVQGCKIQGRDDAQRLHWWESRGVGDTTRSGGKWAADTSVAQAESLLKLKNIIVNPCIGRQGLGSTHFQQWGKADPWQRRDIISSSGRGRNHHSPRRPRRASCKRHNHVRWGWTWEENYTTGLHWGHPNFPTPNMVMWSRET